jgi:PEGA domain
MLSRLIPLLALLTVASCAAPKPVQFSSSPPGARVLIDEVDTGFVTPCVLEIKDGPSRKVEFALPGYLTEQRVLVYQSRKQLVFWREAALSHKSWNFPLWLGSEDFFIPLKGDSGEAPARVYVRMRREADR